VITEDPTRQPDEGAAQPTTGDAEGNSFPPERFWAIVNARVVVKATGLDEIVRRLEEMGADRDGAEVWEGNPHTGKVEYSWSCRRIPPERAGNLFEKDRFADNPVRRRNEELARRINEEALANPQSPYAGKFVGILNGQVVVVADDLDEVNRRLQGLSADTAAMRIVEASRDYSKVEYIWCCR
jgi:hypothetical protein